MVVTYDYDDHKVKGIDRRRALTWVGGQGAQRGTFANVTDLQHDSGGNVRALVWAYSPRDSSPAAYDSIGTLRVRLTLSPQLERLKPPASARHLARGPRDSVLIAYEWSDRFVIAGADGRGVSEHQGIVQRACPEVVLPPLTINGQQIKRIGVDTSARLATASASWPHVYVPFERYPIPGMTLFVRSSLSPSAITPQPRRPSAHPRDR